MHMESQDSANSVNWEQGRDNNGNEFIRLNMCHVTDADKKYCTELTIGSDGRNSASSGNGTLTVEGALAQFAPPVKLTDKIPYDEYLRRYPDHFYPDYPGGK